MLKLLSLVVLKVPKPPAIVSPHIISPFSADRFLVHGTRFSEIHVSISTLTTIVLFFLPTDTNFGLNGRFGALKSQIVLKGVPKSPLAFRVVSDLKQSRC